MAPANAMLLVGDYTQDTVRSRKHCKRQPVAKYHSYTNDRHGLWSLTNVGALAESIHVNEVRLRSIIAGTRGIAVAECQKPYRELIESVRGWEMLLTFSNRSLEKNWSKAWRDVEISVHHHESQLKDVLLRGKVDRIDGDIAHVTLTDDHARETFADCNVAELSAHGIGDGDLFECIIQNRGRETVVTLKPVPERVLSPKEWKRISAQIEEELSDYSLADDY